MLERLGMSFVRSPPKRSGHTMSAYEFCAERVQHERAEKKRRLKRRARFPEATVTKQIAGCLYSLRHIGGDVAVTVFLSMKWKEAKAATMSEAALLAIAKRIHDSFTEAERTAWRYPRNANEESVLNAAHKHMAELRLVRWILRMNFYNGVAPKGEDMAHAYRKEYPWRGMPWVENHGAHVENMRPASQRKWAERLRRHWNLKIGTLKVEAPMGAGEVERKDMDSECQPRERKSTFGHLRACCSL